MLTAMSEWCPVNTPLICYFYTGVLQSHVVWCLANTSVICYLHTCLLVISHCVMSRKLAIIPRSTNVSRDRTLCLRPCSCHTVFRPIWCAHTNWPQDGGFSNTCMVWTIRWCCDIRWDFLKTNLQVHVSEQCWVQSHIVWCLVSTHLLWCLANASVIFFTTHENLDITHCVTLTNLSDIMCFPATFLSVTHCVMPR
jgi:hypothetical protein